MLYFSKSVNGLSQKVGLLSKTFTLGKIEFYWGVSEFSYRDNNTGFVAKGVKSFPDLMEIRGDRDGVLERLQDFMSQDGFTDSQYHVLQKIESELGGNSGYIQ